MRGRSINSEGFAGAGSRIFSTTSARFIASYCEANKSNVWGTANESSSLTSLYMLPATRIFRPTSERSFLAWACRSSAVTAMRGLTGARKSGVLVYLQVISGSFSFNSQMFS